MQYQMGFKFLILIFLFFLSSCGQSEKKEVTVIEATMAPIKKDYTISWKDSSKVKFKLNDTALMYPKIDYDSAKLLFYWGYNLEEGSDTTSYFPVNSDGKWISTVMKSYTILKPDLWKVDSLLGSQKSYDESSAAGGHYPKYGIIYFKNGSVIGQTSIGPGSQTIRTTFKLPQPSYFKRLNNSELGQIDVVFRKKLNLDSL